MTEQHDIIVLSTKHDGSDWETIDLLCETCSRLIYASDAVDPDIEELNQAAVRHRRKPEWIEQSAANIYLKDRS